MDERYRKMGLWIGLGALGIVFLCVMLCGLGTMAMFATARGPAYMPLPAGEGGAVAPPPYHGYAPMGMRLPGALAGFGTIFGFMFFGVLLLLFLGMARRIFWGAHHWRAPYPGRPPRGKEWKDRRHAAWGPWAWHSHGRCWEPEAEPASEEDAPGGEDPEYAGPQE